VQGECDKAHFLPSRFPDIEGVITLKLRFTVRISHLAICVLLQMALLTPSAKAAELLVFAAASMKNALDEADAAYKAAGGSAVTASYASSSVLAKQIEQAAPADIFISADSDWMDYVATRKLIKADSRANLVANRLVLIAPKASDAKIEIAPNFPLAAALGEGKLSMGDPGSVPAGLYGKAALTKLGVWEQVRRHVIGAENVRAALAFVSRGEAPFGIVYETDAKIDPGVKVIGVFPEDSHDPIVYPVAITQQSHNDEAGRYLAYLESPAAREIFQKYGFTTPR
jgi:molybdate transport system substrate-binding protein